MATEMGAIILFFTPTKEILNEFKVKNLKLRVQTIKADADAKYSQIIDIDISKFVPMVAKPGHPHDVVRLSMLNV